MNDYVKRDALLRKIKQYGLSDGSVLGKHSGAAEELILEVELFPSADVAPVRRGHWERHKNIVQCSRCGFGMFPIDYVFDRGDCVGINVIPGHCPKCGAILEVDA